MDPGRFRSGRWWVLIQGVLVSAYGIAGLVLAAQHPHAGPTGVPVLGLASTPSHSGILLALGVVAIAGVANRRVALIATALGAAVYTLLVFVGSVATARGAPTVLGFHAADIVLHGGLAVVNLSLLMWLTPDELSDRPWVRRRGRERGRHRDEPSASEAVTEPAAGSPGVARNPDSPPAPAARARESGVDPSPPQRSAERGQPAQPASTSPPERPEHRAPVEQPTSQDTHEPSAHNAGNPAPAKHLATRAMQAVTARAGVGAVVALAVLGAAVCVVIWIRHR